MERYRSTMILSFDVWADSEEDAVAICQENYHEFPHVWEPNITEVVDDDDDWFHPINEMED